MIRHSELNHQTDTWPQKPEPKCPCLALLALSCTSLSHTDRWQCLFDLSIWFFDPLTLYIIDACKNSNPNLWDWLYVPDIFNTLVIKHCGGIKSVENLLMVLWSYTLNGKWFIPFSGWLVSSQTNFNGDLWNNSNDRIKKELNDDQHLVSIIAFEFQPTKFLGTRGFISPVVVILPQISYR